MPPQRGGQSNGLAEPETTTKHDLRKRLRKNGDWQQYKGAMSELHHTSSSTSATPLTIQNTSFNFVMEYSATGQDAVNATPDTTTSAQSNAPSPNTTNGIGSGSHSISQSSFSTSPTPTPNTPHLLAAPSDSKLLCSPSPACGSIREDDRTTKSSGGEDPNLFRTIIIPSNSCIPPRHPEDMRSLSLTLGVFRKPDGEIEFVADKSGRSIPGPQDRTWVEGGQLIPTVSDADPLPENSGTTLSLEQQAVPLASTSVKTGQDESLLEASNTLGWSFDHGAHGMDNMALDAETAAQFNAVFGSFNDSSVNLTSPVVSGIHLDMAGATDDISQQTKLQSDPFDGTFQLPWPVDVSLTNLDDASLTHLLYGGPSSSGSNTDVPFNNTESSQMHEFSNLLPESLGIFSSNSFSSNDTSPLPPTSGPIDPRPPHEPFPSKSPQPSHPSASLSSHPPSSPAPPGKIDPIYIRTAGGMVDLAASDGYLLRIAMGHINDDAPMRTDEEWREGVRTSVKTRLKQLGMTEGRPTPDPSALERLDRLNALKSKDKEKGSADTAFSNASVYPPSEFSKPSTSTKDSLFRSENGSDRILRMLGQTPNPNPDTPIIYEWNGVEAEALKRSVDPLVETRLPRSQLLKGLVEQISQNAAAMLHTLEKGLKVAQMSSLSESYHFKHPNTGECSCNNPLKGAERPSALVLNEVERKLLESNQKRKILQMRDMVWAIQRMNSQLHGLEDEARIESYNNGHH